jgi:hypothetical protein
MGKKDEVPDLTVEQTQELKQMIARLESEEKQSRAAELIQQLDELAAKCESGVQHVALCTGLGLIYSWQTHKLSNLEFALACGGVVGFITVRENADDDLDIHLVPLINPRAKDPFVHSYEDVHDLIGKIDEVWEVCACGIENEDEDFRKKYKVCSECGRHSEIHAEESEEEDLFGEPGVDDEDDDEEALFS